jgi:hypothetical protein
VCHEAPSLHATDASTRVAELLRTGRIDGEDHHLAHSAPSPTAQATDQDSAHVSQRQQDMNQEHGDGNVNEDSSEAVAISVLHNLEVVFRADCRVAQIRNCDVWSGD